MDIVFKRVGEIKINKIDNVINDDEINYDTDEEEGELPADQDIEEYNEQAVIHDEYDIIEDDITL